MKEFSIFQIIIPLILPLLKVIDVRGEESSNNETTTVNPNLTGNPQMDYIYDPNLPRELNGYNLSSYPFFTKVPPNINFSCDGLKDGFYASIPHKCQLYHHCLFGTRYDFLCANYTAFDQRTFICQFVSEVDCENSALFFHRNDALYKTPETTTVAPVIIYLNSSGKRIRPHLLPRDEDRDSPPSNPLKPKPNKNRDEAKSLSAAEEEEEEEEYENEERERRRRRKQNRRRCRNGRGRRCRRPPPRPSYDDYYYDEEEDDDYYYDTPSQQPSRKAQKQAVKEDVVEEKERVVASPPEKRKNRGKINSPYKEETKSPSTVESSLNFEEAGSVQEHREKIFSRGRAPPRIRPPVPLNEKNKYSEIQGREISAPLSQKNQNFQRGGGDKDDEYDGPVEKENNYQAVSPSKKSSISQNSASPQKYVENFPSSTSKTQNEAQSYDYYDEEPTTQPPPKKYTKFRNFESTTLRATTTTRAPTTTTTTTPPPPLQEYDYEDYGDYEETMPSSTTTIAPSRSSLKNFRRNQETGNLGMSMSMNTDGGVEHVKINEALEAPSIRIPYHNRPRPSFAQTTNSNPNPNSNTNSNYNNEMSSNYKSNSNIGFINPNSNDDESKYLSSTLRSFPTEMYDGMNRRFPAFDASSTPSTTGLNSGRRRNPVRTTTTTEQAPIMDYEDVEETMPERYGQKQGSVAVVNRNYNDNRGSMTRTRNRLNVNVPSSPAPTFETYLPTRAPYSTPYSRPQYVSLLNTNEDFYERAPQTIYTSYANPLFGNSRNYVKNPFMTSSSFKNNRYSSYN